MIGSGPNGLVAASYLARAGMSVEVFEANEVAGGALGTVESTLPGFLHDIGAAFFPFGSASPALVGLDLPGAGLVWKHGELESAHPAIDGTCAAIARDVDVAARTFGEDGDAWRDIAEWYGRAHDRLLPTLLATFPPVRKGLALGPSVMLRLARVALSSGRGYAESTFKTEAARRVFPGLALHTDVGPDDPMGAVVGFMLGVTASHGGFAVPEGGAGSIARALLRRLAGYGGKVHLRSRVARVLVESGRAIGIRTERGDEIRARYVLADTGAPQLFLGLLGSNDVPGSVAERMRAFVRGFGTFKMDWALDGPVPWKNELCRRAAVVHPGDSNDDLARFTREIRRGDLPENPYLVVGQQSLLDPTRAPEGKHTLWAYSRVPNELAGGWDRARDLFARRIEDRIEGLAPGFKKLILGRTIVAPPDLEAMNANLAGGDLGGGSAQIQHQLLFRPMFPYFRYRTPIRGLYLCSSYTHPGAGVHGACGFNAAEAVLSDAP